MNAVLDFALLPPEINSARMYSGPGSGPMLAAASAWKGLAAELRSTALSYNAVLSALTSEEWHGPAASSMAAAAGPYVAWMDTTAAQAEQTAAQAEAAAAAHDVAFNATVSPAVIAANRVQLMALIASNIVGQNTPAIAATEAQYAEMWAQDAAAMYAYAASSAVAARLTPFSEPAQNTNPVGLSAQSAAVGQAATTPAGTQQAALTQLMAGLQTTLQGLSSPVSQGALGSGGWNPFAAGSSTDTTGLNGVLNLFGSNTAFGQFVNANVWNSVFSSGFYMPSNTMAPFLQLAGQQSAETVVGDAAGPAADGSAGEALVPAGGAGQLGQAASAGLGRASLVGPLSVPPSWTAPTPSASPLAPTLGGTPMIAPPAVAAGMPGVPVGGMRGQAYGRATPQYGFRPAFVVRPPAAG